MKNVTIKYRRCPKCGKIICYKLIEDDGRDWMGHHWGEEKTYTVGYDCDANLQLLSKTTLEITYRDSVAVDSVVVYKVR